MDEREPKMLRAFTAMEVNPAGQLELKHIKSVQLASSCSAFSRCKLTWPLRLGLTCRQMCFLNASVAALDDCCKGEAHTSGSDVHTSLPVHAGTLTKLGLSATDDNANAMIKCAPTARCLGFCSWASPC